MIDDAVTDEALLIAARTDAEAFTRSIEPRTVDEVTAAAAP